MTTKHLLFLAHAPSDNTRRLRDAVVEALAQPDFAGVDLRVLAPQDATASDVMPADGLLLLTTENIGYMAGLTKDFFDRSYDDLLEQKPGLPVATLIRAVWMAPPPGARSKGSMAPKAGVRSVR